MIQLDITRTAKMYTGRASVYDESSKTFSDLKQAKEWLEEEYGNCKRVPMYRDRKDRTAQKVGYIYSYKNYEYEDGKKYNYIEQHWIAFNKVTPLSV